LKTCPTVQTNIPLFIITHSLKTILLILLFGLGFCAFSQEKLTINTSDFQHKVTLGGHFTLYFEVEKTIEREKNLLDTLVLPANWSVLTHKKTIIDNNLTRYSYTVCTSRNNTAGEYFMDFRLLSGNSSLGFKRVSVFVEEVSSIEIVNLTQHEYVQEGDVILSKFLIQNAGNKTEKVRLKTSRGNILNIKEFYNIEPDSSVKIYVQQIIPVTEQNFWQTTADVSVISENQKAPIISFINIPVYSSKIKKSDKYLRFPVDVGVGYFQYNFGNQVVSAYQYYASGNGFLDFDSKNHLSFSIRGPNQFDFPAVGSTDEYALSYSYKEKTTITAGDYLQRLNNLMEFGRYGRGLKIDQKFEKTSVSVFYQKARFFPNQKDAFGGSFKYNFNNRNAISFNFISKNLTLPNRNFTSNIIGTSLDIRKENLLIESEIAMGEAEKKLSLGFYNKFYLRFGKFQLNNEIVYADKDFHGFYNNSWLFISGVNYTLSPKISLGINTNLTRTNPSLDVNVYSFSPFVKTYLGFVSYQPNQKNLLTLNFINQEREDRQTPSKFHYKEDLANFSYMLNTNKFQLNTQSRYGFSQNLLSSDSLSKNLSYSNLIQPSVRIVPWMWIGAYLEHQHTRKFTLNNSLQNLVYYGGSLRINMKKNLSASLLYRNNYNPDQFFELRTFLDASLNYESKHHQFSISCGQVFLPNVPDSFQNTMFFTAKYILKLNLPIAKNKKLGSISGEIYGINNDILKEGVMVELGEKRFMTDATGKFYFKDLVPDQYSLKIISNKIGVISTTRFPMQVDVKADSVSKINVSFIKTGGVVGKINFEYASNVHKVVDTEKIPMVLVTLYNDKESYTTQMNNRNEFSFKEMKPDSWKIKVYIPGNQPLFTIQNPEQSLEIESDKLKVVNFNVQSTERKIHFSNRNYNLSLNK
jgi:hypothetical protein